MNSRITPASPTTATAKAAMARASDPLDPVDGAGAATAAAVGLVRVSTGAGVSGLGSWGRGNLDPPDDLTRRVRLQRLEDDGSRLRRRLTGRDGEVLVLTRVDPTVGGRPGDVLDHLVDRPVARLERTAQGLSVDGRHPTRHRQDVDRQQRKIGGEEDLDLYRIGVVPLVGRPEGELMSPEPAGIVSGWTVTWAPAGDAANKASTTAAAQPMEARLAHRAMNRVICWSLLVMVPRGWGRGGCARATPTSKYGPHSTHRQGGRNHLFVDGVGSDRELEDPSSGNRDVHAVGDVVADPCEDEWNGKRPMLCAGRLRLASSSGMSFGVPRLLRT